MRTAGRAPHIIMLQEAFIGASIEVPNLGGYPNWVKGPGTNDLGRKYSERATKKFIAERSFWKGEKLGKWQSSGLLFASDFPIVGSYAHPFNQWECAGHDCLANKGLLVAFVEIPGVPQPVAFGTVHYNSRFPWKVSTERALIAHNLQVAESDEFLRGLGEADTPFIWGGDFNMRHMDDRIKYFVERSGAELNEVSSFCVENPAKCEVLILWGTNTPWYETQDLQGWVSGSRVKVKPLRVEELFDEPVDGIMPSDHNGLLVTYRLSWPI